MTPNNEALVLAAPSQKALELVSKQAPTRRYARGLVRIRAIFDAAARTTVATGADGDVETRVLPPNPCQPPTTCRIQ